MRALPMNAAAPSAVTPVRPGRLGSAPLSSSRPHDAPGGRSRPPHRARSRRPRCARRSARPSARNRSTSASCPDARRARERHGAEPVARQHRRARGEQPPHQRLAAFVGGREQGEVQLHGGDVRLDRLVAALEFAAGGRIGGACGHRGKEIGRQRRAKDQHRLVHRQAMRFRPDISMPMRRRRAEGIKAMPGT